jgi:predicted RNase H-like HicB family nuclease
LNPITGGFVKIGVVVQKDEDGYFVASVPELPGCHTQAKTLDEVIRRIKEAVEICLDVDNTPSAF